MAQKVRRKEIGSPDGLRFVFLPPAGATQAASEAWGGGQVWLGQEPIWPGGTPEPDIPADAVIEWSWLDLLEFLAKAWPWLVCEESYPIPVVQPSHPGLLRAELDRRWEQLPDETVEEEEEAVYRFENRHDLARGLKGIYLPSLFVMRQGRQAWVVVDRERARLLALDDVIATLEQVGNFLAEEWVAPAGGERAAAALRAWSERGQRLAAKALEIRTGLRREQLESLQGDVAADDFWELPAAGAGWENELLAAARMTAGVVSPGVQRAFFDRLRRHARRQTPELDKLSAETALVLDERSKPYEQGYAAAVRLRDLLDLSPQAAIQPAELLERWGVAIEELPAESCPVEALAAWGPSHGPVILLNTAEGARPAHVYGRRTTLAHEICHLLLDRSRALPMAEVLGGATPALVEQRANAFAAELLLPREAAAAFLRKGMEIRSAVEELRAAYAVSRRVIGWQIIRSSAYPELSLEEQGYAEQIARGYDVADAGLAGPA